MAINLLKLLCPQRHCVADAAYDTDKDTGANVILTLTQKMAEHGMEWRCGICQSEEVHWEDERTGYRDLKEACRVANALTADEVVARMAREAGRRLRNN